jgi:hypothetical protein
MRRTDRYLLTLILAALSRLASGCEGMDPPAHQHDAATSQNNDNTGVPHCGNGILEPDEECDGDLLDGATCEEAGFGGGTMGCQGCWYSYDACVLTPFCGNGTIDVNEYCDGTDLGGATCESLGLPAGTLACLPDCVLDSSGCGGPWQVCGDGVQQPGEECDLEDFAGQTCVTLGFGGGELDCTENCTIGTGGCTL